jgi:hypothetical protein
MWTFNMADHETVDFFSSLGVRCLLIHCLSVKYLGNFIAGSRGRLEFFLMSVPLPKLWALSSLSVAGVSKLFYMQATYDFALQDVGQRTQIYDSVCSNKFLQRGCLKLATKQAVK